MECQSCFYAFYKNKYPLKYDFKKKKEKTEKIQTTFLKNCR